MHGPRSRGSDAGIPHGGHPVPRDGVWAGERIASSGWVAQATAASSAPLIEMTNALLAAFGES